MLVGIGVPRLGISFKRFVVLLVVFALPGCALLGSGSAPLDTYELSAPVPSTGGKRRKRVQVLVAEPAALKSLDGQNIVIKPAPDAIEFLNGAQWSDRLPKIVQAGLIKTFQQSRRLGAVGRPGEGLAIDYQITTEIRAFEVRAGAAGDLAYVELHIRVLNDRNGVVRSSRSFTASAPVIGDSNADFVRALDNAFDEVAVKIVNWSIRRM